MDSSQLSRVCGHGHIKKFWLLQTQKESKTCENRIIDEDVRKSPLSPSELSSHTELSRRSSQSYGDNAVNTERKDFASAFSSDDDDDDDDEGELGTVENASNLHKKKKKKSSIELGDHRIPSNISSSSSSSSCDFGSSLRSSYCSNVASEVEEEIKFCVSGTRDGFGCSESSPMEEEEDEEEEEEEEETLGIGYVNHQFHQDSLISPCGRSNPNETHCSSPTSIMEVVCGEEPENPSGKKLSPRLAIRVNNEPNGNSELATQVSESDEVRLITHQPSKFDLLPEFSDFAKVLEVARVSNAASLQESRNRSPNKSYLNPSLKECALCGATKTPMWRSGPQGPKSLCNACGIRYKKYRSYPSQSDVIMSDTMVKPNRSSELSLKQQRKRKWHHHLGSTPLKSIYRYPFPSRLKRLSNINIEHQSVRRTFAEEEEAAVLLMHLSCGLVY